jgi:hypothetical protein
LIDDALTSSDMYDKDEYDDDSKYDGDYDNDDHIHE